MRRQQAVCDPCWRLHFPKELPDRVKFEYRTVESCVFCAQRTSCGIYVWMDVTELPTEDMDGSAGSGDDGGLEDGSKTAAERGLLGVVE